MLKMHIKSSMITYIAGEWCQLKLGATSSANKYNDSDYIIYKIISIGDRERREAVKNK